MSFGVRRGLPYKKFMNIKVGKLKGFGMLQNILNRNAPISNCFDENSNHEEATPIRFEKVVLPFIIFAISTISATIIMALEKCFWKVSIRNHLAKEIEKPYHYTVGKKKIKIPRFD